MLKRRLVGLLLLPLLTLIFVFGWVMFFIGDEKENEKLRPRIIMVAEKKQKEVPI